MPVSGACENKKYKNPAFPSGERAMQRDERCVGFNNPGNRYCGAIDTEAIPARQWQDASGIAPLRSQ